MKHPWPVFLQSHCTRAIHRLQQCLWKARSWMSSCTRKLLLNKISTGIVEVTVKSVQPPLTAGNLDVQSRKILPAAEGNSIAGLPWQLTVAWGNGAKLSLLALQQVIHQQLSHPCPRLAHPKPREGWMAGERKHNKPSSTNSCHLGVTVHRPATLFAKYCLQLLLQSP